MTVTSHSSEEKTDIIQKDSFLRRHGTKLIALAFWLAILGGYWWYISANDLTIEDSARRIADILTNSAYGPLIYIILYIIRPLIFFPATLLTVLSGFLFGPIWGVIYTILGSNASAMLAFSIGFYFGKGVLEDGDDAKLIQRYAGRMRDNSFETVLLLRLLFLPYDLVNYSSGFLRIGWKAFLLATIIGSIPGTISFVLLGTSFGTLDELLAGELKLNPAALALSILLILGSIGFSRYLKKRESSQSDVLA